MKPAAIALLTLALTAASAHPAYEPDQLRDVDGEFMSFYTNEETCEAALANGDDGDRRREVNLNFPAGRAIRNFKAGHRPFNVCMCFYIERETPILRTCEHFNGRVLSGKFAEFKERD